MGVKDGAKALVVAALLVPKLAVLVTVVPIAIYALTLWERHLWYCPRTHHRLRRSIQTRLHPIRDHPRTPQPRLTLRLRRQAYPPRLSTASMYTSRSLAYRKGSTIFIGGSEEKASDTFFRFILYIYTIRCKHSSGVHQQSLHRQWRIRIC